MRRRPTPDQENIILNIFSRGAVMRGTVERQIRENDDER
jgi:hypothetical protein